MKDVFGEEMHPAFQHKMAVMSATSGPWKIIDHTEVENTVTVGYIDIIGPNNEAICTIFPDARNGVVGIETARLNAELIIRAVNDIEN